MRSWLAKEHKTNRGFLKASCANDVALPQADGTQREDLFALFLGGWP